ncbi:Rossmann-fold NAD(P)-binding domain-containing protein [Nonomuraea turcica]|uniref:hypothetical protein n=1 Tax=Nonomuraea sp. G32 TaxID=3067274 RepID=UPI00273CC0F2|nr:hypothetical protein [Nonomuraea sp. G32]MDP4510776.1 hypothetical protein [Nonomuraea sp. G32]
MGILDDVRRLQTGGTDQEIVDANTETPTGVHVTFERSSPRRFDLVVGADGIHSAVRRLAFGPESDFASDRLDYDRYDAGQQKDILARVYAGVGWQVPAVMKAVHRAGDVYLDSISQVRIDRYSKGRVVLLGDSAYGNTLGGFGTGLAVVGAYVLAGELAAVGGDMRNWGIRL